MCIRDSIKSDVTKIYQQVDNQEANQAVIQNSIKIISQDILSPQILKAQSERDVTEGGIMTTAISVVEMATGNPGTSSPVS